MESSKWGQYVFLLRHALPYRRLVITQFALMGFSIGIDLLKPWPLQIIVDHVAGDIPFAIGSWSPGFGAATLLVLACLGYLVLHAGGGLVQFGSTSAATLLSARMIRDLRAEVLRRLQELSLRFHDSHRVGDLVHRLTFNTAAVETAFQSGFMGVVKSSLKLISMFAVMLLMNWRLTVIALVIVPFLLVGIRWYAKRIHKVSREQQDREGNVSSRVQEILSSIRLVLAFSRESREQRRFEEACEESVVARFRSALVQNGFGFAVAVILAVGTALLYWVGIRQVQAGNLSIGEFLVFNAYLAQLYSPLSVLTYTTSSVQSALGGGSRIFDILSTEPEIRDRPDAKELRSIERGIRFEDVSFGYRPEEFVLRNIDLSIAAGETVAVVGETGGGKTTLLNLLLRFYDPQAGRITIDGTDIRELKAGSLRKAMALVPQESILLGDTIRENIAFGDPEASDEKILEAARLAEAHEFISEFAEGYDTLVGERGVRLSMGQRQRIALARAFLKDAPVLLLDEPTSALDAETEARLLERIQELSRHRTIVLVAHRLSTIRDADRIVVLKHGEIVESGAHGDLMVQRGAYHRLWHTQSGPGKISVPGKT